MTLPQDTNNAMEGLYSHADCDYCRAALDSLRRILTEHGEEIASDNLQIAELEAALERGGHAQNCDTEFAWLIERNQLENHSPTVWLEADWKWTEDAWKARRFQTKEAAEEYMREHSGVLKRHQFIGHTVQHGFVPALARCPAPKGGA